MGLHRYVGPGAVLGSGAEGLPVTLKRKDARRQNSGPSQPRGQGRRAGSQVLPDYERSLTVTLDGQQRQQFA